MVDETNSKENNKSGGRDVAESKNCMKAGLVTAGMSFKESVGCGAAEIKYEQTFAFLYVPKNQAQ
ncbi:hypothetical protein T4E_12109 [Trichinella pseudospiralis]|uniref:Uncharacterized protein n=1 Tax=Trichinella pseudospiralis TaxID=6337 RepID=A0A0V0YJI9_TRIPS|nr:hypothetical protein T4E_12109 [Trichinella pseudospiralis]